MLITKKTYNYCKVEKTLEDFSKCKDNPVERKIEHISFSDYLLKLIKL